MLSDLIRRALERAAQWHEPQFRKHPSERVPYIVHPVTVAWLLDRARCSETTMVAGLLHDVIEDCGITRETVADEFGEPVADLVSWVTDQPGQTFDDREADLLERVKAMPLDAVCIKAADATANAWSLIDALKLDPQFWSRFGSSPERKIERNERLFAAVSERLGDHVLTRDFRAALDRLKPST